MNSMESSDSYPDNTTTQILSNGLLTLYEPELNRAKTELKHLINKQNSLYIELSNEKHNFSEGELRDIQNMINKIKIYKEKLVKIRRQMTKIHQKSKSLKKKSIEIQEYKVNEYAAKQEKLVQEELLIGKRQTT